MMADIHRAKTCRCGSLVDVVFSRPMLMHNSFARGVLCQQHPGIRLVADLLWRIWRIWRTIRRPREVGGGARVIVDARNARCQWNETVTSTAVARFTQHPATTQHRCRWLLSARAQFVLGYSRYVWTR